MVTTVKVTNVIRGLVITSAFVALGLCVGLHVIFELNESVIMRWKFQCQYALSFITFLGSVLSTVWLRRLRAQPLPIKPQSRTVQIIFTTLSLCLTAVWWGVTFQIMHTRERQVLPVDHPVQRDRDSIPNWSSFRTLNDENIFDCRNGDPRSSLGQGVSKGLCQLDQAAPVMGAICGLFVLVECVLALYAENEQRRLIVHGRQKYPSEDYALGSRS
ncbi:hypothetical protein DFQ27_007820 [Actinomortierella ambigua]|uniref:Uncharacterized protein n=1 Tax=Actinomortierella ambigua TaxID=1343610 RepID=A0A9P6TZJ8_9FUNG|nr:hypothetical protein DFQ27_007820 [Actinomortierella ambigua]